MKGEAKCDDGDRCISIERFEKWAKRLAMLLTLAILLLLILISLHLRHPADGAVFCTDGIGSEDGAAVKSSSSPSSSARRRRSSGSQTAPPDDDSDNDDNDDNNNNGSCCHCCADDTNSSERETIIDLSRQISDKLGNLWHRVTVRDHLQPNDACPTWTQGLSHFQHIGPKGEYSSCYYKWPRFGASDHNYEYAASTCESKGAKLVEIDGVTELQYLETTSGKFWLGAVKDAETGLWHWEQSGQEIDFVNLFPRSYHGDDDNEIRAVLNNGHFEVQRGDRDSSYTDVICEAPSKFAHLNPPPSPPPPVEKREWSPDDQWDTYQSRDNVTYLFSKFKQPWFGAERICRQRGGWLAEIESERENAELVAEMKRLQMYDAWLGAKWTNESGWRWNRDDGTFRKRFTDWPQSRRGMEGEKSPRYLALSPDGSSRYGHSWSHASRLDWRKFICEIFHAEEDSTREEYLSGETCLNANGTESLDSNRYCFRFVKLQYTREKAETFCRDELNGTLAFVKKELRPEFNRLLRRIRGNETVSWWMEPWWMELEPTTRVTFNTSESEGLESSLRHVFIEGYPICGCSITKYDINVICRHLGMPYGSESFDKDFSTNFNARGYAQLRCNGREANLDRCTIRFPRACQWDRKGTIKIACRNPTSNVGIDECLATTMDGAMSKVVSSINSCESIYSFVCEVNS